MTEETNNTQNAEAKEQVEKDPTAFDHFIEHQRNAMTAAGKALESLIPQGVREHGRTAVRETLEGYRGLFNSAIDELIDTVKDVQGDVDEFFNRAEQTSDEAAESVEEAKNEAKTNTRKRTTAAKKDEKSEKAEASEA